MATDKSQQLKVRLTPENAAALAKAADVTRLSLTRVVNLLIGNRLLGLNDAQIINELFAIRKTGGR